MAKIKFQTPDNSPQGKRRMVAASGGYNAPSPKSGSVSPYPHGQLASVPITKNAQFAGSGAQNIFTQPMFFSPMHTPQNWQIASKRREIYQWARFYYENEPTVAAGVDFYANFPMNGFKLESKSKKVLKYFENITKKLELTEWLNYISHEYFLIGDVFPFLEIECPKCHGSAQVQTERGFEICNHPDGTIKSIKVMNPDYIEVQDNVLAKEPVIALVPDEELKGIIQRKSPKQIYNNLPERLVRLVSAGQPIPLSNRSVSHIKHNASPYGTYGTSMLRRLFTVLAYKTKIMTANWIVAERLILPIRVVKIGDKDRPASENDIQDVVNQLASVANDPNLTIVTHHAFDYEWYGASGKIHNITQELEQIGKEILNGFMLNQAILNGEAAGYNSAQVGVEVLIKRIENWRNKLADWVEKNIFLPIAMMQGFVDEKETEEIGETVYVYPKLKWNDLNLRDNSNRIQVLMQAYDKQLVSAQTVLEELKLDYDTEIQRIREEQALVSQSGMFMGGGDMGGGAMGAMGGMGGDMGMGGGPTPPGMEGGMDMGMGGGMDMGMGGPGMGGDMGMGASASSQPPIITKRGKGKQQEEVQAPPPKVIKLTKLEQQMYKMLQGMKVPYKLFGQFSVRVPNNPQPFSLDFAYPQIGVGIETDGSIWHDREDTKLRDQQRDQKLANVGWRILRFKEDAISEHPEAIKDVVMKNIMEASKQRKKSSEENNLEKYASLTEYINQNQSKDLKLSIKNMPNDLGEIWIIGE